jgi:two-component system OmpR family sensor kinase
VRFSLKTKISLLFLSAILGVVIITLFVYFKKGFETDKQVRHFVHASISSAYDRKTRKIDFEDLENNGFVLINDTKIKQSVLSGQDKLAIKQEKSKNITTSIYRPDIIEHSSDFFAVLHIDGEPTVFQITPFQHNAVLAYMLFALMSGLLFLLYFMILKSIKPLHVLREKIREFSEGNDEIDCKIKGSDEIAEVANEFDAAVKKIRALREARQLFLRNIMHEFKTPITRGKLSVEMLDKENPYRQVLGKVFVRQENLLNEFMRIEQLGTGELKLERDNYQLRDIVDYALDIVGENAGNIDVNIGAQRIYADFDLLATAIKNLLDNALLYSEDKKASIKTEGDTIVISNVGKALEFPLNEYKKPFLLQGKKQKEARGFGFGLFISLNIFDLHGIKTSYKHEEGKSVFVLSI